jgi:sterol desaturase/sphingolipid hydroxylase (fatty acid hydroxylase superfamily)
MNAIILALAAGCFLVEWLWPANALPRVKAWWPRVLLVNGIQLGMVFVAGVSWDRWLAGASLFQARDHLGDFSSGLLAYFVSSFVYYWWHRLRHESKLFWLLCHQLHHSPRRIEIAASFYKHPVEIFLNSLVSSAIIFTLLGSTVTAGAWCMLFSAAAEFFYHWNVRTPRWLGYLVQRPESHRVHHRYRHHTQNFADLPLWDMLFGTFKNPRVMPRRCGFDDWREARFEEMLAFRDVHRPGAEREPAFQLLPTCIGCAKRWACYAARKKEK